MTGRDVRKEKSKKGRGGMLPMGAGVGERFLLDGAYHGAAISRTERTFEDWKIIRKCDQHLPAHFGPSKSAVVTGLNPLPQGPLPFSWVLSLILPPHPGLP